MGFFSLKAVCAICGKEVGLNRYKVPGTKDKWRCPECARAGGALFVQNGEVTHIKNEDTEVKMRCNTCGGIYSYTMDDLVANKKRANSALLSGVAGVAGAISGFYTASAVNAGNAQNQINQIIDYTKCPHCNSRDVAPISDEELQKSKRIEKNAEQKVSSIANEIKKFKELLDAGIITQEEFDTKKKELLGI